MDISDLDPNEPLDEKLKPYVQKSPFGSDMIHHPLLIELFLVLPALTNRQFKYKLEAVQKARSEHNWTQYIFLHERPYRIDALKDALEEAPERHWELIRDVWIDSENIHQFYDDWYELWQSDMPKREQVMDEEERNALDAMPETIKVWRGVAHEESKYGMSWTIDKEKAHWFANRFAGAEDREPEVVCGSIKKEDVLAYFTGRGESEIVAFTETVLIT